jgi:hypothetical protein
MNKLLLEKYISVAVQKALKEQEVAQQKSEKSMYLIYRFPGLKQKLEDLMSPVFGRFISNVNIIAPKPTTFKIELVNSQMFYAYYLGKGEYMFKISGKKYYAENLGDLERASGAITALLELNYAPLDVKEEIPPTEDKGAELGAELSAAETTPEIPTGEEAPEETPEEEIEI